MKKYDVMVIGGGPGGYSAAIAAGKAGKRVVLFEGGALGGTCLNVGCIPTKYFFDKAAALEKIRALTAGGVFRDAGMFSFRAMAKQKDEVVARLTRGVGSLLRGASVDVVTGYATLSDAHTALCGGETYQADNTVIATGSEPTRLPIPGAELCVDSTGALAFTKVPKRLAVIGGGVIGLELASAYAAFGSEVTVLEFLPELLPHEMPEAVSLLRTALEKRGIQVKTGAKVTQVSKDGEALSVLFLQDGQAGSVPADAVLMAVGRRPRLTGIDCRALGIETRKDGSIAVDSRMRTSLPGVYAIGDAAGGYQLAHAAYAEGEVAVKDLLGVGHDLDLGGIPHCVYANPSFASVGLTPKEAEARGYQPVVGRFDYAGSGMALAEGASGAVFAVMDRTTQKTLGFTVVGEGAGELIAFAGAAVKDAWTLEDYTLAVVAHPSLSEMLKEAALAAFGKAIHR